MTNFLKLQHLVRPPPVVGKHHHATTARTSQKILKTKGVKIMKNYQRLYYQRYYAQNENGEYVPVSKKVCFAPAEAPTGAYPYKQRLFYDPEAGYSVRLERSKRGEDIYRTNDTSLKREERYQERKFQCIWKGTKNCDQDCTHCSRTHKSRTVELDKNWKNDSDDDMETHFEPVDETADITEIIEDKHLLSTLFSALEKLSPEDRELWNLLKTKAKKKVIADKLNLSIEGVRYREKRLFDKLRSDEALKKFFEKN